MVGGDGGGSGSVGCTSRRASDSKEEGLVRSRKVLDTSTESRCSVSSITE